MALSPEVKNFIKNTLILTISFTVILHLGWSYIVPIFSVRTDASINDLNFDQANMRYLGNIATAMSIGAGRHSLGTSSGSQSTLGEDNVISITEVFSDPNLGQSRMIGSNMLAISNYHDLLSTDILSLLDGSADRSESLTEHINLLRSYYSRTENRMRIISEQMSDLRGMITSASRDTTSAKSVMQNSFVHTDYTGVDTAIDTYITAKDRDTRARVYLVYLENFQKSYTLLQRKNLKLLDTLMNNRDALIKGATVVIPNSGSELVRELKLIQTEAEVSATNTMK